MTTRCNEYRSCEYCSNQYIAKLITSRFCSVRCMYSWRSKQKINLICKNCNIPFFAKKGAICCSQNCMRQMWRKTGAPEKVCEWCNAKYRSDIYSSKYCSKRCMYYWRKSIHWETVNCIECGTLFSRRINEKHHRTGLPKQFCTNKCSLSSAQKREKLKRWGKSSKNHLYSSRVQEKIRLKNGNNISKPQRLLFEKIQQKFPDAILEYWLEDVNKTVDIYIPSKKTIYELYGTYWHCDPKKYSSDYFNAVLKKTAQELWTRDAARTTQLELAGYNVNIIWERDVISYVI